MGDLVEVNDCLVESDLVIYMSGWSGVPAIWGGYLGGGQGITVGLGRSRSILTPPPYRIPEHKASQPPEPPNPPSLNHTEPSAKNAHHPPAKNSLPPTRPP